MAARVMLNGFRWPQREQVFGMASTVAQERGNGS
jgi:hypothetical protein